MAYGVRLRYEVFGGGRSTLADLIEEGPGQYWWNMKNGDPAVSNFLTGLPFNTRPMSRTNLISKLAAARDLQVKEYVGRECGLQPGVADTEQDKNANAIMALVCGGEESDGHGDDNEDAFKTPPKKRKHRPRFVLDSPVEVEIDVPGPNGQQSATVKATGSKYSVNIKIDDGVLQRLQEFVMEQLSRKDFKRHRAGCQDDAQDRETSVHHGVSWSTVSGGAWRASWYELLPIRHGSPPRKVRKHIFFAMSKTGGDSQALEARAAEYVKTHDLKLSASSQLPYSTEEDAERSHMDASLSCAVLAAGGRHSSPSCVGAAGGVRHSSPSCVLVAAAGEHSSPSCV